MSKILFIGGTGNISAECAALLHQRGHEITVLTRGRSPVPAAYRALHADRKDPVAMRTALSGLKPDVVINFVGYELADVQLDHAMFKDAVAQYLFISTAAVYAKPVRTLPITEDAPRGNRWWDYAQKKLACEQWLEERWEHGRFPVTIVRPSHTYSKHWVPNPVSSAGYDFAARLEQGRPVFVPDDGQTPWTLTAASDFAAGFAGLIGHPEAPGEAIHITSDEVLTWNQICLEIADAVGAAHAEIVPVPTEFICLKAPQMTGNLKGDKSHAAVFDNAKIKRLVPGFGCRKAFRVGVRESVAWLRAHSDSQDRNPQIDVTCEQVIGAWRKQACS
jgi:nucleoside-diphosphate-sugar epimerase